MTPKECYLEAGRIHYEVCQKARSIVKPGAKYIEIARQIEAWIQESGASLAFPVNLQVNNLVHYSPIPDDPLTILEDDLIKVDVGVHVNGYVADGAFTLTFDPSYQDMVDFTRKTLAYALKDLKPGMPLSEIGRKLDECMKDSKYKIIRNLMGHQLNHYHLHSHKSVLVYENKENKNKMEVGDAFAVEIFITDGEGWIRSAPEVTIYSVDNPNAPVRNPRVKKLLKTIWGKRKSFPFSERYVIEHLKFSKVDFYLLLKTNALHQYQILIEKPGSKIAQFEDVIYIDENEVILTTQPH
jgi:methionyl aminopeptidase